MPTFTVAEVIRQKKLAKLPVVDYREENGKVVIEVKLRPAKPAPEKRGYDPEKLIAILRAGRINLRRVTNVTRDIRRERNSSPILSSLFKNNGFPCCLLHALLGSR